MSRYGARIAALERRYERDRARFDPWDADPSTGASYLREGAGQAIHLYVEARTGDRLARFSEAEFEALERSMNGWFELYARCHGVELEATFTVREAAELYVRTHNVFDVAQLLTRVPER